MSDSGDSTPKAPQYFATGVAVGGNSWVVNLIFNQQQPRDDSSVDVPAAIVSIPWPLAKAMAELVLDAIAQFEVSESSVPLPKSYVAKRDERRAQVAAALKALHAGEPGKSDSDG